MMKRLVLALLLILAGAGVGGAAAIATTRFVVPHPPKPGSAAAAPTPVETQFVPVDQVLAPLVLSDGRLAGYVRFDAGLEVATEKAAEIGERLPLLRHAINMRTYRAPLAAGRDGMLPDVAGLQRVVQAAAIEVFGRGAVRKVAITKAEPA